jgi:hypothetical protein
MNKKPYEAWFERKPTVSHLRVFECVAYTLVNSHHRKKLDAKSEKCIFIGYCIQLKGYRLYNPKTNKTIVSRYVMFDENMSWRWNSDGVEAPIALQDEDEDSEELQPEINNMPKPIQVYRRQGNQLSQQRPKPYKNYMRQHRCLWWLILSALRRQLKKRSGVKQCKKKCQQ